MNPLFLPTLNAVLNTAAAVLLLVGRALIRRGRVQAHQRCMIAAFVVSSLFLASYLTHKLTYGLKLYHGHGWVRGLYFAILIPHVALALTVPVFAITLIALGLRRRYTWHRRIAVWAWPIWMFVSVTGVVVYLMLYPLNPAP